MFKRLTLFRALIISFVCLSAHTVLAGERATVFTLEAINVEEGVVQATSVTIATEIESRGYTIVDHRAALDDLVRESAKKDEPPAEKAPPSAPTPEIPAGAPPVPPPPPAGEVAETAQEEPPATATTDSTPEDRDPDAFEEPPVQVATVSRDELHQTVADEIGCDYYFDGSLVRLGRQMKLRLAMYRVDGKNVATKTMDARTEDDLPIVIPRIVEALLKQRDVAETRNLDNATRAETQNLPQRSRLEKNFGVILGQAFGLGDMNHFTQIAFDGRFEFNDIIAEIDAGMAIGVGDNDHDIDPQFLFDIAVGYYLSHTSIAPYIGAGVGMFIGDRMKRVNSGSSETDYADNGSGSMVGWNVFPFVGLELLRQSSIRLHFDFRYLFDFAVGERFGHAPMLLGGINF